jgi:hypothetical protein
MDFQSVDTWFFLICGGSFWVVIFFRFQHALQYHIRKKFVGPSYWGVYQDNATKDAKEMETIKLHRPSLQQLIVAGSSVYSKGQAVKSLRR